jgi:DNA-binding XRE family transcriptional regulator
MSESVLDNVEKYAPRDRKVTQNRQKRQSKKLTRSPRGTTPVSVTAEKRARKASTGEVGRALAEQRAFAANLVRLRLGAGLTQDDLAARSGISQSNISALENSTWEPRLSTIFALAKAFGVAPAELVPGWDRI